MRKIEFFEQTQETLLVLRKREKRGEEEQDWLKLFFYSLFQLDKKLTSE